MIPKSGNRFSEEDHAQSACLAAAILVDHIESMSFGDTASGLERDEARIRSGFWPKLKRVAANLPFAEDLTTSYYCAFDDETPLRVRAALLGALGYFILPFDFMPDLMPLLGYGDDAAVLAGALKLVFDNIKPEHRAAARQALERI